MLTAAVLQKIEPLDSVGDRTANGDELTVGNFPSDASSAKPGLRRFLGNYFVNLKGAMNARVTWYFSGLSTPKAFKVDLVRWFGAN